MTSENRQALSMRKRHDQSYESLCLERRRFLCRAGAACEVLGALASLPAVANTLPEPRSVRFIHTHPGETLTASYFDGRAYNSACLSEVNHLLRDFRTGESHPIDPALLDILYDL